MEVGEIGGTGQADIFSPRRYRMRMSTPRAHGTPESRADALRKFKRLPAGTRAQVEEWMRIYRERGCVEHYDVNELIGAEGRWDEFPDIRSENTHENGAVVYGIFPFYFWMACELLQIDDAGGSPLVKAERY